MKRGRTIPRIRRVLYRAARALGDVDALLHPQKLPKRLANKLIGRVVGRLYRR